MRSINKLSPTEVTKTTKPGRHGDGGGLYLQVSRFGTKSWIFRFMLDGKAREMGLGSIDAFSLKEARERARQARQMLADGLDPIDARHKQRAAMRAESTERLTFAEAAERYIAAHRAGWRNAKHADQWRNTLDTYAAPVIGGLPVSDIDTAHVLKILEPIWTQKAETASRLRGRIEAVLDWATARRFREGPNPAAWRGHLDKLLPKRSRVAKVRHHPALPYAELPAFMARLGAVNTMPARALELTILTAARTGEATCARWNEIDLAERVWTIPAERMKGEREHRVPLSDRTVDILKSLPREGGSTGFVFPGQRKGRPISSAAMLELIKDLEEIKGRTVVHGLRSTFRDWAGECTSFPREVAEAALSHQVGDKTEAAYRRGDALEKRRRLMEAWAAFACGEPEQNHTLPAGLCA